MGYNWQKMKMKKMFLLLFFVASIGINAIAQCSFKVTDANPSINGTTVTITVTVEPAFTPSEKGTYTVVVKPEGQLKTILDSQSKSVSFYWNGSQWNYGNGRKQTVTFTCSVNDNSYNQCNSNSFYVSDCWKQ